MFHVYPKETKSLACIYIYFKKAVTNITSFPVSLRILRSFFSPCQLSDIFRWLNPKVNQIWFSPYAVQMLEMHKIQLFHHCGQALLTLKILDIQLGWSQTTSVPELAVFVPPPLEIYRWDHLFYSTVRKLNVIFQSSDYYIYMYTPFHHGIKDVGDKTKEMQAHHFDMK